MKVFRENKFLNSIDISKYLSENNICTVHPAYVRKVISRRGFSFRNRRERG